MTPIAHSGISLFGRAIKESTRITFPLQMMSGTSTVTDVARLTNGMAALFLQETPFHPVDPHWPDQPADTGSVFFPDKELTFKVEDCQVFAIHKSSNEIKQRTEIARADLENYYSVVAHIINPGALSPESLINAQVMTTVDALRRNHLSAGHTACHLAALAMNLATNSLWSKDGAKLDSLKSKDLDQEAMDSSLIFEDRSEDVYRFGKSIKKKGFPVDQFFKELPIVETRVNQLLTEWMTSSCPVTVEAEGVYLDSRRTWVCELPIGKGSMACGGTHVKNLSQFSKIEYKLQTFEDQGEKKLRAVTYNFLKN